MATDERPKKGYKFFRTHAQSGAEFTLDDLAKATGWTTQSIQTYKSKQWSDLLEKSGTAWIVRKEFLRLSQREFLDHITQRRPLFSRYARRGHEHYVLFEFLLPLTRESQLRAALDHLFYTDTIEQRLREIGVTKLAEVVERQDKEPADAFFKRVVMLATTRFGGYSISHVSGRYRAATLMSRQEVVAHEADGAHYLIDETTASVRFIIPCQTGKFSFSDTLEADFDWMKLLDNEDEVLQKEIQTIRKLFFVLFVESVVRTVKGEEEIWLVESGAHHRLYRWERLGE